MVEMSQREKNSIEIYSEAARGDIHNDKLQQSLNRFMIPGMFLDHLTKYTTEVFINTNTKI